MFETKSLGLKLDNSASLGALETETLNCLNSRAHSPYSNSPSAVGLELDDGLIVCGAYLESAAFNPSLNPAQTALINLIAQSRLYESVVKVVLLETQSGRISQCESTRLLFSTVCPKASFERVYVSN